MLKTFCITATLSAAVMTLLPFASTALGQGCFMQTSDGRVIDLSSLCPSGTLPVYTVKKFTPDNHRNQWGLGLDLPSYCKQRYGSAAAVTLQENNALGWKCTIGEMTQDISFTEACRLQYGPAVRPGMGNFDDISSWHCRLTKVHDQSSGS